MDDSHDNISRLNSKLNEMTSIYWIWKNYWNEDVKYIGFNHYRRMFSPADIKDYHDYDIIVAKPYNLISNVLDQYSAVHHSYDINVLLGLLQDSIKKSDLKKFATSKQLYAPCNMFIMKKELFDEYCNFMFPKLLQLEKLIVLDDNDRYQHRALAFLSERMTSFWMMKQKADKKKIKEIDIQFFKDW